MTDPIAGQDPADLRYRAFVSYSHADTKWALWLVRMLETWRIPKRLVGRETPVGPVPPRLAPIFRDRDELAASSELGDHIQAALEDSASLIVICSPSAASSRWVNEEILTFKRLGRARRIFALIVDGDPDAGEGPDQCFPPALRHRLGADGELTDEIVEPAAADVRPGGDGKWRARLKLRAGLLGIDYDDLAQREHQRRNRRLAGLSAASVAGMLLTGYLAYAAVLARDNADRNRERAEDLVGFMLGDLTDSLRAVDRLELFDAIGGEALDYFESLDTGDLTTRTLAQRADAMNLIGEIAMDQGQFSEAIRAFTQSAEQARKLVAQEADQASWQGQLSDSELWLGFAFWQKGQLDDALMHFRLAMEAADQAIELDPASVGAMSAAAGARNNIAQVLEQRGEIEAARRQYEQVLELQRRITAVEPDSREWQAEVGFAHNTLGQVDLRLGQVDSARWHYEQDLAIKRDIVAAEPDHVLWRYYLAISENNMAYLAELTGNKQASLDYVSRAIALTRPLVQQDPEHVGRQGLLGRATIREGRLARMQGELEHSRQLLLAGRAIFENLIEKQPENVSTKRSLASSHLALAETLAAMGQHDSAIREARAGVAAYEALAAGDRENVRARMNLASAEVTAGQILAQSGEPDAARASFRSAIQSLETLSGQSIDPGVRYTRVAAHIGLGEIEAARSDVAELLEVGYRAPDFLVLIETHGMDLPP